MSLTASSPFPHCSSVILVPIIVLCYDVARTPFGMTFWVLDRCRCVYRYHELDTSMNVLSGPVVTVPTSKPALSSLWHLLSRCSHHQPTRDNVRRGTSTARRFDALSSDNTSGPNC